MQTFADWVQFSVASAAVILFLVIIALLLVLIAKRGQKSKKNSISIECLNESLQTQKDTLLEHVLKPKILTEHYKARKAEAKKKAKNTEERKRIFVLSFEGDIAATAGEALREQITAILGIAQPTDEVVVRVESAGGMVHSYGLASSQLLRIRDRGLKLTACVDKVAASGGYMMACVANKVVAAPFAIIGSIGAVSAIPNFHRLLKKHDVDYLELTAGEHKRTLSLFGEVTEQGKTKHQEQLNLIHSLFKNHVAEYRPQSNMDQVATGEYWPAKVAMEHNLVDEIRTSDDLLISLTHNADVYLVKTEVPSSLKDRLVKQFTRALAELSSPLSQWIG
jgi:serine protease SohB